MSADRKRSAMWEHFKADYVNKRAKCNYCEQSISFSSGSLGNLGRHLKRRHPRCMDQVPKKADREEEMVSDNEELNDIKKELKRKISIAFSDESLDGPELYEDVGMEDGLAEELFDSPPPSVLEYLKVSVQMQREISSKLDKLIALEQKSLRMKSEEHEASLVIKKLELQIKSIELKKLKRH